MKVIDVATGTADLAIALAKKNQRVQIVGIDISEEMLKIGDKKIARHELKARISLTQAPAERLPLPDSSFDLAMVAFGVRNFNSPIEGLEQIYRTLRDGGRILVLEFTSPMNSFVRVAFGYYFRAILPYIGRLVSGHINAYSYLPVSVEKFAERDEFLNLLTEVGFKETSFRTLSFGIVAIYEGHKKKDLTHPNFVGGGRLRASAFNNKSIILSVQALKACLTEKSGAKFQ